LLHRSRFMSMLMAGYDLEEMGSSLKQLDHRNFAYALSLADQQSPDYIARAEGKIAPALEPLFSGRERTLQRLSATFRRADLVEMLR